MKKLFSKATSMVLIASMLLPLLAISVSATNNTKTVDSPPWVEDGEIWHPADEIMPLEDFGYCPQNHRPPAGYTYQGYTEGNSLMDAVVQTGMVQLVAWLPGIGTIVQIIDAALTLEWLVPAIKEGHLRINYFKYVYINEKTYAEWYHYSWYYRDEDGLLRYVGCKVEPS